MFIKHILKALHENRSLHCYAPYSNYNVGCAVIMESGKVFDGYNVENSSYGLTLCAERIAVSKWVNAFQFEKVHMIVIAIDGEPSPPCGACLQFIGEFAYPGLTIGCYNGTELVTWKFEELVPIHSNLKTAVSKG